MTLKTKMSLLVFLTSLSIVSIGFSSWSITVETNAEAIGNIEVDNVINNNNMITQETVHEFTYSELGFTNSNVNVVTRPITTDIRVVIMNTPKIVVITLPKRLGCLIFAIDVVIVKNINGTMITNIKFINKSPNGLNTAAFSPYTNPTIAPIIRAARRIIVCL